MRGPLCALALAAGCAEEPPRLSDLGGPAALGAAVEAERLMPWVERLADDHARDAKLECGLYPAMDQYPSCELSRERAVALVQGALADLGYAPSLLVQGMVPDDAHNVVAELRGTTRANEVVLIAAHVDAFFAGADDNSSGVSVLLEVARVAKSHRFARTVRFVGFDLEERGARGSTRYVEAGLADDVVAALVLECVGYADARPGSQDSPPGLELGSVGDTLVLAANAGSRELARELLALNHALSLTKLRAVVAGGSGAYALTGALLRSDNGPFWLRGRPALMLTDTANYRNPHYHRATDTPETLDRAFLAANARFVAAALGLLAEVQP